MTSLISRLIVFSRWAMVPLFLGLGVALLLLVSAFFKELWGILIRLPVASETELVMALLALIDLTLIGGLLVIVICSGYENFVEKIEHPQDASWPEWMTRISFSGLKQKLFASMMAIAGVSLLKALMKLEVSVSETQVKWLVVANIIFVGAYAVLVLTDHVTRRANGGEEH